MRFIRAKRERVLTPDEDLRREYALEAERFLRYSIPAELPDPYAEMSGMNLDAAATRLYHRVEKGFSLAAPRRPTGRQAIPGLTRVLANPQAETHALYADEARRVLEALEQWNDHGILDDEVAPRAESLPGNPLDPAAAAQFITSRHSVRDFDQRPVDRDVITEAVRIACSAPSVCNRQAWRVTWFDDRAEIARILSLHSGSAAFADRVPALAVVTYDLRAFEEVRERNQGWIDGGLFSMALLLALHGLGLGAVALNWSRRHAPTQSLRRRAGIADHENVVMLIAAGHSSPGHRVARSARRPIGEILRFGSLPS